MRTRIRWPQHQSPQPRPQRWLRDLWPDLGYASRQLRRAPGVTVLIVATLALGIGANVTMAGVIDRLLLRAPTGIREPERLARLLFDTPGWRAPGRFVSYPALLELQRGVAAFEDVAASTPHILPFGVGLDARDVTASLVTASFFPVLGVVPALGRAFGPDDGYPEGTVAGGPALAVLAHGFWQQHFGGDSAVIGRALRIGKLTYTVVGVAPAHFRGLDTEQPDLWLPLTVTAEVEMRRFMLEDRGMSWLAPVARLRRGVARATAEQQATTVARRDIPPELTEAGSRVVAASIIPGRGPDAPREVRVALWLGAVSALVLLIACANVANLLLARAFTRRREIAVRLALGAGRGRLARQMLAEAGVLAALGGVAALGVALTGAGIVRRFFLSVADAGSFVDARLFGFTAVIALGTGVLVSLAPLAQSAVPDLTHALRTGGAGGGGRSSRVRSALLGAQAALCMLLLVVAGLFAQSLRRVQALDLGLVPERTLTARFDMNGALMTNAERDATSAMLVEQVEAIPGVRRAVLLDGTRRAVNVHTSARGSDAEMVRTSDAAYERAVDAGYFRALGSSLRGRDFLASDVRGAPRVTIISEPLARLLFPGGEALGQCVYLPVRSDDPDIHCWTVVGVLRGFWYPGSILKREGMLVYVPRAQRSFGLGRPGEMVVSASGNAAALAPQVRAAILRVRPDLPHVRVRWMRDVIEPELRPWRLGATMFSLFGAVALLIATVGLYAVVAFTASQRATEVAVRMALGARARHVLAAVAGDGLRAVLAGLGVGLVAALVIRRWIGPLLFQTSPSDPGTILAVAGLLLGVAVIAIVIPTARSLRRSPASILRVE